MGAVVNPAATRLHELAGRNHRGMGDNSDEIALAPRFNPQHAKPVLGIVECDAINQPGQEIGRRGWFGRLNHSSMMNRKNLRRYEIRAPT